MSELPTEFIEMIKRKRELELLIQDAIVEFENSYQHKIEVDCISMQRMRAIGPRQAIAIVEIRVGVKVP